MGDRHDGGGRRPRGDRPGPCEPLAAAARRLDALGVDFSAPSIATEHGRAPIQLTLALPVPDDVVHDSGDIATRRLPGVDRAATTVIHGDPDFDEGFDALWSWIRDAGEVELGELREVYLDCDGPRSTWVTELQLALRPRPRG